MAQSFALVSLVVNDYDEAIDWYITKLNFYLLEDTQLTSEKRWVVISPSLTSPTKILLAKAANDKQKNFIGNQAGGRVFLFLQTDNFKNFYSKLVAEGVKIIRKPTEEVYGMVCVFEDLYGNLWDLIQPCKS